MRALAVALPTLGLDLERRAAPFPDGAALALLERRRNRDEVVAAGPGARARGVRPGRTLAEARALAPDLLAPLRDPAAERAALEAFAAWARAELSPQVAVCPADGDRPARPAGRRRPAAGADAVLVDLRGTDRLHGDEAAVLGRVRARVAADGLACRLATADAAGAALALARWAPRPPVLLPPGHGAAALRAAVAGLPAACLGLEPAARRRLAKLGLVRVAQVLDLPREALPARFGAALLRRLDELLGRAEPDLAWFRPPEPLVGRRAFGEEPAADRGVLVAAASELAAELAAELVARHEAAVRLRVDLLQEPAPAEPEPPLELELAAPTQDAGRLVRLLALQLERAPLASVSPVHPVAALRLAVPATAPARAGQPGLFAGRDPAAAREAAELAELLTRLELELGGERVVVLASGGDPRPERSARPAPARGGAARRGAAGGPTLPAPRPLRLLGRPLPAEVDLGPDGAPRTVREPLGGSWRVAAWAGPERIETGWWEAPVRRDYYRVVDAAGRAVWVFADLDGDPPAFFLHGVFA